MRHQIIRAIAATVIGIGCACFVPRSVSAAVIYVDCGWGDDALDGSTNIVVAGTSHGPKQTVTGAIDAASGGDTIEIAPGFYQEFTWDPGEKNVTLHPHEPITVYDTDPWQTDSDGDGMPDGWEVRYGLNASANDAGTDADSDDFTNLEEFLAGTDPSDPDSHANSVLTIPNAWAIYVETNLVEVVADIRSTNQWVAVKAAEYFLDSVTGVTNGAGMAMSATDGSFNSTNEQARAVFTPGFPAGERHEIFIHAQGKDNQWCPFVKVIINPSVSDILEKVRSNYSKISDISYVMTRTKAIEGEVLLTENVTFRQKGPYRMRWDNQSNGKTTIVNGNEIAFIDANGRITPLFLVVNDDPSASASQETFPFWDVDRFLEQHESFSSAATTDEPGRYLFNAAPKSGVAKPYDFIELEVDFRYGLVTTMEHRRGAEVSLVTQQDGAVEISAGVWFHSQQRCKIPVDAGWDIEEINNLQMQNLQINTALSDDLFDF